MHHKQGVFSKKTHGKYIAVISGRNNVFEFNETAGFIWNLLKKPISKVELIKKLCREYDVTEKQAEKDIITFIETYSKEGLIDTTSY